MIPPASVNDRPKELVENCWCETFIVKFVYTVLIKYFQTEYYVHFGYVVFGNEVWTTEAGIYSTMPSTDVELCLNENVAQLFH